MKHEITRERVDGITRLWSDEENFMDVTLEVSLPALQLLGMHFKADPKRGLCVTRLSFASSDPKAAHFPIDRFDPRFTQLAADVLNAAVGASERWIDEKIQQGREEA